MPTMVNIGPGEIKFIYDVLGNKCYKFPRTVIADTGKITF